MLARAGAGAAGRAGMRVCERDIVAAAKDPLRLFTSVVLHTKWITKPLVFRQPQKAQLS